MARTALTRGGKPSAAGRRAAEAAGQSMYPPAIDPRPPTPHASRLRSAWYIDVSHPWDYWRGLFRPYSPTHGTVAGNFGAIVPPVGLCVPPVGLGKNFGPVPLVVSDCHRMKSLVAFSGPRFSAVRRHVRLNFLLLNVEPRPITRKPRSIRMSNILAACDLARPISAASRHE